MPEYRDRDGESGILTYEVGLDWIEVKFENGQQRIYRYTNASAGAFNIATMKRLAAEGNGLNGFINRHVKNRYVSKR